MTEPGKELSSWADPAMFEAEPIAADSMPKVTLLSATPDPLGSLAAMAMMYEGRVIRDLEEISDEERERYFADSFKTRLRAPWEAIDLHFMVENVSRAFTHQMVRQRTAVYAQESLRFAVKTSIAARPGPLVASNDHARREWDALMEDIWESYNRLIKLGMPAEEARGVLPQDTLTRLHYKTNLRNLAEHLGNRLCTQAQFEWRLVASELRAAIRDYQPMHDITLATEGFQERAWQFEEIARSPIFQPICFSTGKCEFTAAADRGCTIRKRVDEGKFGEIHPMEWLADPKAGWVR